MWFEHPGFGIHVCVCVRARARACTVRTDAYTYTYTYIHTPVCLCVCCVFVMQTCVVGCKNICGGGVRIYVCVEYVFVCGYDMWVFVFAYVCVCECLCSHLYVSMHVSEFGYVLCVLSHDMLLYYHICKIICRQHIRLHYLYYLQAHVIYVICVRGLWYLLYVCSHMRNYMYQFKQHEGICIDQYWVAAKQKEAEESCLT